MKKMIVVVKSSNRLAYQSQICVGPLVTIPASTLADLDALVVQQSTVSSFYFSLSQHRELNIIGTRKRNTFICTEEFEVLIGTLSCLLMNYIMY